MHNLTGKRYIFAFHGGYVSYNFLALINQNAELSSESHYTSKTCAENSVHKVTNRVWFSGKCLYVIIICSIKIIFVSMTSFSY